jgi:hypothetical protein
MICIASDFFSFYFFYIHILPCNAKVNAKKANAIPPNILNNQKKTKTKFQQECASLNHHHRRLKQFHLAYFFYSFFLFTSSKSPFTSYLIS